MVVKHVRNIMELLWSKEDVKCKNFSTVYVSKMHRLFCIITSTATNKQQTTPKQFYILRKLRPITLILRHYFVDVELMEYLFNP